MSKTGHLGKNSWAQVSKWVHKISHNLYRVFND